MNTNHNEIMSICAELSEFIALDETCSDTEVIELLIALAYKSGHLSETLLNAVTKELQDKLSFYKNYAVIIESEETETITKKTKALEWHHE